MRDPFVIDGPTALSFSGGSTSGYMLKRTLQANTPEVIAKWLRVMFGNTGREDEMTLRFVRDCGKYWGVPIAWLEYRNGDGDEGSMYAKVSFETASRNGEPFEALIRKRNYLPNPVTRFCTSELKIRTMHRYLRAEVGWPEWDQFIGIRADEQRRVSKIRARGTSTKTKDESMCMPLADAGVTWQEVDAFWAAQPFKLELARHNGRTLAGNCDLCFLKPPAQRLSLIRERPERAIWWARMESEGVKAETRAGALFCKDGPSYSQMAAYAADQDEMFDPDQEALDCFCGD